MPGFGTSSGSHAGEAPGGAAASVSVPKGIRGVYGTDTPPARSGTSSGQALTRRSVAVRASAGREVGGRPCLRPPLVVRRPRGGRSGGPAQCGWLRPSSPRPSASSRRSACPAPVGASSAGIAAADTAKPRGMPRIGATSPRRCWWRIACAISQPEARIAGPPQRLVRHGDRALVVAGHQRHEERGRTPRSSSLHSPPKRRFGGKQRVRPDAGTGADAGSPTRPRGALA